MAAPRGEDTKSLGDTILEKGCRKWDAGLNPLSAKKLTEVNMARIAIR